MTDLPPDLAAATVVVAAGRPPRSPGAPINPPIELSSTYAAHPATGPDGVALNLGYGRASNATWAAFEAAVGTLEGGDALCFASGMAAISAALTVLPADGPLVAPLTPYNTSGALIGELEAAGREIRRVDVEDTAAVIAALHGAGALACVAADPLALTVLMVVFSGALVSAAANSSAFPYRISFKDFSSTPTPFQPNAFANILEDGTIELLPQPIYTPTPVPVISRAQLPDNQLNILLLGCDDFSDNGFRTDVIMLLSLNPKHRSINLISFPRDLYVTIPGYWSNRINTAWGLGGFDLLADTFQANFGIHPDYYMMVNYNGFKDVVNSLDGIDVEVTQELQDSCKLDPSGWCIMEPGVVHMDGGTALWYSRSRLTTSDFDRNRRAQDVVKAIFRKAMNLNVVFKLPELYGAYRDRIDAAGGELLILFEEASLNDLGDTAQRLRLQRTDPEVVTYIIDRNINYTNVCNVVCTFCAFYRRPGKPETYVHSMDEICTRIDETIDLGGTGTDLSMGPQELPEIRYGRDTRQPEHAGCRKAIHGPQHDAIQPCRREGTQLVAHSPGGAHDGTGCTEVLRGLPPLRQDCRQLGVRTAKEHAGHHRPAHPGGGRRRLHHLLPAVNGGLRGGRPELGRDRLSGNRSRAGRRHHHRHRRCAGRPH